MRTADTRARRLRTPIALTGVVGVVVAGTTVVGVVAMPHGGNGPPAPTAPSVPTRTALIIPIPVAPTALPTIEVAAAPRVVRRHP